MYCKSCQREISAPEGSGFCPVCGSSLDDAVVPEVSAGEAEFAGNGGFKKDRIAAAVLALLFGAFGIHKFYLGYRKQGLIMFVGAVFSFKFLPSFFFGLFVFVGIAESLGYLLRDDRQFAQMHRDLGRPWF